MTIFLIQDMVTCLNIFPSRNGISSDLGPEAIILGSPIPDYNKLRIAFGSYAKLYIGTTNIAKQRTVGEIILCPENVETNLCCYLMGNRYMNTF